METIGGEVGDIGDSLQILDLKDNLLTSVSVVVD